MLEKFGANVLNKRDNLFELVSREQILCFSFYLVTNELIWRKNEIKYTLNVSLDLS